MLPAIEEAQRREEAETSDIPPKFRFSEYDETYIAWMVMHDTLHRYLEPALPYLLPEMLSTALPQGVYGLARTHWEKHGTLPPPAQVEAEIKKGISVDEPGWEHIQEFFARKPDPRGLGPVLEQLDGWLKFMAWRRLVDPDAIAALARGDFALLQQRVAEAEAVGQTATSTPLNLFRAPAEAIDDEDVDHLMTGFPRLDAIVNDGGPSKGETLIWMAPTNRGKSLVLANAATRGAMNGQKTLVATLEMSRKHWGRRCVGVATGVPLAALRDRRGEVEGRLRGFAEASDDALQIEKLTPTASSVATIRQLIRTLESKRGWRPDVVVVDYLELLVPRKRAARQEAEHERQKAIADDLRWLADEEDVLVLTATQTNREGFKNAGAFGLGQAGESYGKTLSTDYIVALHQTEEERSGVATDMGVSPIVRQQVIKNRNGAVGQSIRCRVDYATMRVIEEDS